MLQAGGIPDILHQEAFEGIVENARAIYGGHVGDEFCEGQSQRVLFDLLSSVESNLLAVGDDARVLESQLPIQARLLRGQFAEGRGEVLQRLRRCE